METVNINNLTGTVESTEEITVAANTAGLGADHRGGADQHGRPVRQYISRSSTLPNSTTQTFTIYDDAGAPFTATLSLYPNGGRRVRRR